MDNFAVEKIKAIHPAMQRLYSAVTELGLIKPRYRQSSLARLLNTTSQRVKNWEARGPSRDILLEIQAAHGINATWVETGSGAMRAADRDENHAAAQQNAPLLLSSNTLNDSLRAVSPPSDRWPLPEADYERFASLSLEGRAWALSQFAAGITSAEHMYPAERQANRA